MFLRNQEITRKVLCAAAVAIAALTSTASAQCPAELVVAADGVAGDTFGRAMALSGDTAVVSSDTFGGAVYVFVRTAGVWAQQAKLLAGDAGAAPFNFGRAVDIEGDTVVVGAGTGGIPSGGIVYVFERVGVTWSKTAALTASAVVAAAGADLGISVAIDGSTIVAGAWLDDHEIDGLPILITGSAYVFQSGPGGWSDLVSSVKLTASDAASQDHFGISVDVECDRIIVGQEDNGNETGAVYVYDNAGGSWTTMESETVRLAADDEAIGDKFGATVSLSGDTVLVGAQFNDNVMGVDAGAAYVFVKSAGVWSQQAKLLSDNTNVSAGYFGIDVGLVGDVAVVAERLVGSLAPSPYFLVIGGSAHLFERSGTTWTHVYELASFDPVNFTMTERVDSLAFDGSSLMVGSPLHDWWGNNSGAAMVFDGVDTDCNNNGEPDSCDIFDGSSLDDDSDGVPDECVDCPGDVDGDGVVGILDFLALLAAWGPNPGHAADLDGDGVVGILDFLALLAGWGVCA